MAATDMRLRLIIRRHGLPEVKLVWPCVASDDLTVASLLSQVNEVVTLESGQWGLEDYAVELADQSGASFECLHFQQVGKLLKQDDQVIIRSLLTEDLRQRRISGRHQISGDGIHLVDGIPFGRRRGPRDRPALPLPPRKRARITYDDPSQDEEQEAEDDSPDVRRLLLEDTPRPDEDEDDDSEDDVEYEPDDDSQASSGEEEEEEEDDDKDHADAWVEELKFAREDNGTFETNAYAADDPNSNDGHRRENRAKGQESSSQLLKLEGMTPAAFLALQAAFPLTSQAIIEEKLDGRNSNLEATYKDLASTNDPALNYDAMMSIFMEHRFNHVMAPAPALLPEMPKAAKPLIEEVEEPQAVAPSAINGPAEDATHGLLDFSSDLDHDGLGKNRRTGQARVALLAEHTLSSDDEDSDSDSDESSSDSDESDDDTSDGSSSGSSVNATSGGARMPLSEEQDGDSSSEGSSDSGSESDSQRSISSSDDDKDDERDDSSSEQGKQMSVDDSSSDSSGGSDASPDEQPTTESSTGRSQRTQRTHPPVNESTAPIVGEAAPQSTVGRAQGLNKTQKRNARRRIAKQRRRQHESASAFDQNEGQEAVGEEMSLSQRRRELAKAVQEAEAASSEESSSLDSSSSSDSSSDSDASPDEESTAKKDNDPRVEVVEAKNAEQSQEAPVATPNPTKNLETTLLPVDTSGLPITTPSTSAAKDDGARKRMKVDMGAGRRLLFGALGLKNPKNKADEEKLKKDLMKDVKPHQNHRQDTSEPAAEKEAEPELEQTEDDNWRDKITYRAVECCYEGMVLSEPPFPFVQRWDPQQQYNSMRKRKRDSQHFEEYYEEDSWAQPQDNGSSKKKKKNKKRTSGKHQDVAEDNDEYIELDYDEPPAEAQAQAGDTQATDLDDLPSLPVDPSTLPPISSVEAKVGMVISWQRLELSKNTNWQPQMLWVTGVIVSKEADKIQLVLAKRDREKDERVFDEDGNRIYDKFEMPEDDEMDEDYKPDDGHRELSWDELAEARLLQGEPSPSMLNSPVEESFEGVDAQSFVENTRNDQPTTSSINDVDSVQLRAGVEEELRKMEDEAEEAPESSSIPNGQTHGFLGFVTDPVEQTVSGNNSEDPSQPSTSDKTAREDALSQNKTSGVVVDSQIAGVQPPSVHEETQEDSLGERIAGTDVDEAGVNDGHSSDQGLHDTPSLNANYASAQASGKKEQTSSVDYPQLPVLSSASSLHSGRQPELNFAEPTGNDDEGTPMPESGPSALPDSTRLTNEGDGTPAKVHSHRSSSSDSFPSLDEIFHTAKTSKMQSPLKSSQGSALAHKNKKLKQEPLGSSQQPNISNVPKCTRPLFPNATQPEPELPSVSTPRRSSRRSEGKSPPFKVPAGSQVITLGSSPASEKYTENYAEDDVDDTYGDADSSSLPKGSGWVAKKKKQPARRGRPRKASV